MTRPRPVPAAWEERRAACLGSEVHNHPQCPKERGVIHAGKLGGCNQQKEKQMQASPVPLLPPRMSLEKNHDLF